MQSKFESLEERLARIERSIEGYINHSSLISCTQFRNPCLTISNRLLPHFQVLAAAQQQPLLSDRNSHESDADFMMMQSEPLTIPMQSLTSTTTQPSIASLPPTHTLLFAADVYFRFCHNQPYSLFHEATLRHRLSTGQTPVHLAWALLASARRFSTLPDIPESLSADPLTMAHLSWECMQLPWSGAKSDEEAVQVCQTIVLLVNVEHPCMYPAQPSAESTATYQPLKHDVAGHCGSAFMKLGFGLRVALHSRLHMDLPSSDRSSAVAREERKRTFWSLYLEDKLISLSRERAPTLRDELCRIQLHCSESAFREEREEENCPTLHSFIGERVDEAAGSDVAP